MRRRPLERGLAKWKCEEGWDKVKSAALLLCRKSLFLRDHADCGESGWKGKDTEGDGLGDHDWRAMVR